MHAHSLTLQESGTVNQRNSPTVQHSLVLPCRPGKPDIETVTTSERLQIVDDVLEAIQRIRNIGKPCRKSGEAIGNS